MQTETRRPILFVSDASPDVTMPEVTGQSFAVASADCSCFPVLSFVDGASLVTVTDRECDVGGTKLFSGVLEASTGILAVGDSEAFEYLRIPVPIGPVPVDVWADHDANPEWVWIRLGHPQLLRASISKKSGDSLLNSGVPTLPLRRGSVPGIE